MENLKKRHGCVSFWLWLVIICNLVYFFICGAAIFGGGYSNEILGYGLLASFALVNILGSILLMRWNKCGFYIFVISSLLCIGCNIGLLHMNPIISVLGLISIGIWFAILQIRKNSVSAWALMESGWDWAHCRHLYQVFFSAILLTILTTLYKANGLQEYSELNHEDTDEQVAIDEPEEDANEIKWKVFTSDGGECSIEAPDDFRNANLNEDQILGVMCSDYDPAAIVICDPTSTLYEYGVKTPKDYANLILKGNTNVKGTSGFQQVSVDAKENAYLIVYDITLDGTRHHCYLYATKTTKNFYYCFVFCLSEYADKLDPIMKYMVESFKVFK